MPIKPEDLVALMREVEREDPIDFADLPFAEDALRLLVAEQVCNMAGALDALSTDDQLLTLLAVASKLVLENMLLHIQLLRTQDLPVDQHVADLLARLRKADED